MEDENDLPMKGYQQELIPGPLSQGCLILPVEPHSLASLRDSLFRYFSDAILLRVPFYRNLIMEFVHYRLNFLWFLFKCRFEKA